MCGDDGCKVSTVVSKAYSGLFMADKFVIVRRCTELLHWLVPKSEAFPRAQRFLLTQRLMASAFDCHDAIIEAQSYRSAARIDALQRADSALSRLRAYLAMVHELQWLNQRQYQHVSRMVLEIGKLLGGWLKQSQQ